MCTCMRERLHGVGQNKSDCELQEEKQSGGMHERSCRRGATGCHWHGTRATARANHQKSGCKGQRRKGSAELSHYVHSGASYLAAGIIVLGGGEDPTPGLLRAASGAPVCQGTSASPGGLSAARGLLSASAARIRIGIAMGRLLGAAICQPILATGMPSGSATGGAIEGADARARSGAAVGLALLQKDDSSSERALWNEVASSERARGTLTCCTRRSFPEERMLRMGGCDPTRTWRWPDASASFAWESSVVYGSSSMKDGLRFTQCCHRSSTDVSATGFWMKSSAPLRIHFWTRPA